MKNSYARLPLPLFHEVLRIWNTVVSRQHGYVTTCSDDILRYFGGPEGMETYFAQYNLKIHVEVMKYNPVITLDRKAMRLVKTHPITFDWLAKKEGYKKEEISAYAGLR